MRGSSVYVRHKDFVASVRLEFLGVVYVCTVDWVRLHLLQLNWSPLLHEEICRIQINNALKKS